MANIAIANCLFIAIELLDIECVLLFQLSIPEVLCMKAGICPYKSALLNKWNSLRDCYDQKTNGSFGQYWLLTFSDNILTFARKELLD